MASGGIVKNVTSVYNRAFPVSHSPDSLPSFRTQQSLGISRDFLSFDRHWKMVLIVTVTIKINTKG